MSSTISRREFIKQSAYTIGGLNLLSLSAFASNGALSKKPNIVLIMADDMGFSDIGCYGGEIYTPNLDRLAKEGLRFTQFYNNAKCAPTRASLLSGLYSQQVGVHNGPAKMKDCITIAEVLKTAGYRTLMSGKWHAEELPVERGFDRYYGLVDGCCNYFNPGNQRGGEPKPGHKRFPRKWAIENKVYQPFTPKDPNFYTTNKFTDYALDYLDKYGKEDKPFFLYIAYTAPHYPLHALPEDVAKYKGKYMLGWDELRKQRYERMKEMGLVKESWGMSQRDEKSKSWEDVEDKEAWDLKMAVYAAMIDRMDQNIGRILDKIDELGKSDNTLILFLSDNGGCAEKVHKTPDIPPGPVESYRTVDLPWANASNTPFRKFKGWDHEGGIATPLIAYWPKVIKNRGSITPQIGHIIDVMATCIDVAGTSYPSKFKNRKVLPLEGKSLFPIFQGKERKGHDVLYWQFGKSRAVRQGKWKLVSQNRGTWELYDLEIDRTELKDLSEKYPEKVSKLEKLYKTWANRCGVL